LADGPFSMRGRPRAYSNIFLISLWTRRTFPAS